MRKDDNVGYVNSSNIKTLSIKTTEQIEKKNLHNFILTSINSNNITLTLNSFYYCTYIKASMLYEIIVFNSFNVDKFIFEPFLLMGFYDSKKKNNSIDLFILDNFFALYIDQNFITFKKIENVKLEDIKLYLTQTYNINIDNIIYLNKSEFRQIRANYFINYHANTNFNYKLSTKDNSFLSLNIFIVICSMIFIYFSYSKIMATNDNYVVLKNLTPIEKQYLSMKEKYSKYDTKVFDKTIELFKYIKLYKITILNFNYKNYKLYISIMHQNKKNLFDFLTVYEDATVKKLEYLEDKNKYNMILEIGIK